MFLKYLKAINILTNQTFKYVAGTCLCHQNITGKRCTEVEPGYFVGFFTLLKFEAEYAEGNGIQTSYLEGFGGIFTGRGYSKLSHHQWVAFAVKLSVTFPFHAVLRYTSPQSSNASIQLHITASRTSNCTAFNTTHFLNPLAKGSGLAWKIQSPIGICKNQEFIFNVTFIGEGHNSTVEVDSLLLIPDITRVRTYQIAQQSPNTLGYTLSTMEACAANSTTLTGSLNSLDICENVSFSVMAEAFTGALGKYTRFLFYKNNFIRTRLKFAQKLRTSITKTSPVSQVINNTLSKYCSNDN